MVANWHKPRFPEVTLIQRRRQEGVKMAVPGFYRRAKKFTWRLVAPSGSADRSADDRIFHQS
jgi:hypothetical protein